MTNYFYILPSFFRIFAPVFLSSEVKEAVMAEPDKVSESSEEVRNRGVLADLTLPFTTYPPRKVANNVL